MAHSDRHLTSVQRTPGNGGNQPTGSNKHSFAYLSNRADRLTDSAVSKKMAEGSKMAGWILGDITALGFVAPGLFEKIDTFKEAGLFAVGFAYLLARLYFYVRKQIRLARKEEWEQLQREKHDKVA